MGQWCVLFYHLQIKILWFLSFPCICFVSSSFPTAVAIISRTTFNRYVESGHFGLIPDFLEILLISLHLGYYVGLLWIAFPLLRYVFWIHSLLKTYNEVMLNFVKILFWIDGVILWILSFILLILWITFINFCMFSLPWSSGMKHIWSWWMIFFLCSCIQLSSILLRIFATMSIKEISMQFCFFVGSLRVWVVKVTVASYNELHSISTSCISGIVWGV